MTTMLTPIDLGNAEKVGGRIFRKQILPYTTINYGTRKIPFTRERCTEMVRAFRDGAFDSVPLVFADAENRHTMDPRQATGEVVDMEVTDDGLDVLVKASDEAAKLLSNHPKVGISARILENYERADGKNYPAAIQHALITWDPRIPGMRPWEAVNLSNEGQDVLDLSGEKYTQEETMAAQQLTDTELEALRALLAKDPAPAEPDTDPDPVDDISDDELAAIAAAALTDGLTEEAPEPAKEPELVAAANDQNAVELANARADELANQVAAIQRQLDAKNFEVEAARLSQEHGLPPAVLALARPLLEGQQVIELSNGKTLDAGKVMRDVLSEVGRQIKLLDLSSEAGSAFDVDKDKSDAEDRTKWVAQARQQLDLD